MPHTFDMSRARKRTINMKGVSFVPDMGYRNLYRCENCHNLQTHKPTCTYYLCHRDDTLVDAYKLDPILAEIADSPIGGTETAS